MNSDDIHRAFPELYPRSWFGQQMQERERELELELELEQERELERERKQRLESLEQRELEQ